MGDNNYDFSGWATKNDLPCSDGRTIRRDAFSDNDGLRVPLVWNHRHDGVDNVLGHALLENREDGVYAYGTFNDTPNGRKAKELVRHGDLTSLSIYANQLMQSGSDVLHGVIREVSLVMAGANPGAKIENVLEHSGMAEDNSAIIWTGEALYHSSVKDFEEDEIDDEEEDNTDSDKSDEKKPESKEDTEPDEESVKKNDKKMKGDSEMLEHADQNTAGNSEETVEDVFNTLSEKQKTVVYALIGQALEDAGKGGDVEHSDFYDEDEYLEHADDDSEETVEDVFNTLSEKQKTVVYALIGQALEDAGKGNNDDSEGGNEMKHNAFDATYEDTLQHSEIDPMEIIEDAKRYGSLRDSVLAHSAAYGVDHIDYLFPDAKTFSAQPEFIKREDSWVNEVINGCHHSPFSRIKSVFADITEDDARAKGYIKGKLKKDEVFSLLKRTTTPTTIYKKQRMDRDDQLDITEFDVVAWIKQEMKMMLNEEIARAILVGDGRPSSSDDKVSELNIRPVWTDADLYTIKAEVTVAANASDDEKAKTFIRQAIKARKNYKGSGNPVLYTTEDMLTDMILLEDTTGRKLYNSETELAAALRVKKIVTVPVMENLTRMVDSKQHALAGIIVNLADYNIGADKGGEINMFDDFDIDYNQQKYLIETRVSGALIKPYAAIALEFVEA